jgi:predicted Co/Zn/Cd cation transporter (cation efflux family)
MGKLGRKVYVELDFLVESGREVGDADLVRRELMTRLSEPGRLLWINVELHTDPAWDRTV